MCRRFTDAKLISYLLQCLFAIFVDKTLNIVTTSADLTGLGLSLMFVLPSLSCETQL